MVSTAFYLGLMSGTSMDGIDAAVCEFDGTRYKRLRSSFTTQYPASLRQRLLTISQQQPALRMEEWAQLDAAIADTFSVAALGAIAAAGKPAITAIGSHGQTLFHAPDAQPAVTLQMGDPNRIAARTDITTVADFRRRDLALGGQGAPLVPAFHHALFSDVSEPRAVVNIGGIANVTFLPGAENDVTGFDTGPGNALMDEWCLHHRQQPYDQDGQWAASGTLNTELLNGLLDAAYFKRSPPKSTGRGEFNLAQCRKRFPALGRLNPVDVQRSFCELTARSIADAIAQQDVSRVLLCGGGALNAFLVSRLRELLRPRLVETTDAHGVDAQWVEAAAFAWLAMRTMNGLPGNLPAVTGASALTILGGIYPVKSLNWV